MLNEITSYEQLHQLMTRTIEGIGYIGQQLLLIETAGYSPEEYHRQRDLMLAYLIQERAKLDYYRTLSDSYLTVRHDYEMLRMLNQNESMGVMGASQADKKQLEEEIISLSAVLPEGLKNEISGTPAREEKVEEEINSIEDLDRRIRDEQDDLVRLHEEARQLEVSVLDGEEYQARKQELDRAFGQVGENLARYISMREDYTIVRSNRERIRKLGSMTPKDDAEKLEIEASIKTLEKENERKSANLTSELIESMAQKEQAAEEEKNIEEKPEKEVERNSEVADAVPEVESTSEEQSEESKDVDINNIEENLDAELQELQEELAEAEKRLQESINAMQETYDKTREERENNVYTTTEELDKADQEYSEIMSALNERYVANRVEVERLRKELERVETLQSERDSSLSKELDKKESEEVVERKEETEESKEINIENNEEQQEKEIDIDNIEEKETEENLEVELQDLREELTEAEERLQNSINAMQEVYEFTRNYVFIK